MFTLNKYKKWYDALIVSAQTTTTSTYSEKHHIIPKCLGGTNDPANVVRLSARQHFIAHHLLTKCTSGNPRQKMIKAFWVLKHTRGFCLTSRQFEKLRIEYAAAVSAYWKGRPMSEMHYKNFLAANKRARLAGIIKGGMHSEAHKLRMIESNRSRKGSKNKPQPGKNAGAKNAKAKIWTLVNEDGRSFTSKSIRPWCIENGMVQHTLVVKSKKDEFYKGWKIIQVMTNNIEI